MSTNVARHVAVAGIAMLFAASAAVAAQRTFVSATGSDAHACSLAQPCRSFATALTHTGPGGEIVVLDSGGYGRVTINQSVTITAPAGVHAGISVFAGTNGIDIPTGGVEVVLRGLSISGQGGTHGIYVSGDNELTIERCDIGGMTGNGVFLDNVAGTMQMHDTTVHDNAQFGVSLAGALVASIDGTRVERNTFAGVFALQGATVTMSDSTLVRNFRGLEVENTQSGQGTRLSADRLVVAFSNQQGVFAHASDGTVEITVARSTIKANGAGGALIELSAPGAYADGAFSDDVFTGNGTGIKVARLSGTGYARAQLTRNVFLEPLATDKMNGFLRSGGGNSLAGGTALTGMDITDSF